MTRNDVNAPTSSMPSHRNLLNLVWYAGVACLLALLAGGLLGLIARDRFPIVALLMYVPLVPLGGIAVIWGVAARGRGIGRARCALGVAGMTGLVCGVLTMTNPFAGRFIPAPGATPLTLIQWNVKWGGGGGGKDGSVPRWDSICRDLARQTPDIVVLSESPRLSRLRRLESALGPTWTSVRSEHAPRAPYLFRLVVASRWRITMEREQPIPSGRVMQALVVAPGGSVRVLVVDGESHYLIDRTPRLRAVAQLCHEAAVSGNPIDFIAGDFNAMGRSVGFDALRTAGFVSAGAQSSGWRGTWPAICPLYDIDHIWIGPQSSIATFARFANRATDHRGIVTRIERNVR